MSLPAAPGSQPLDVAAARRGLAFVFWGGLVVIVDVTITGIASIPIDVVNDTIGYAFVGYGIFTLALQPGPGSFSPALWTVVGMIGVLLVWSVVVQLEPSLAETSLGLFASVVGLAVGLTFCFAMRELARAHSLERSARYWTVALAVALVMWTLLVVVDVVAGEHLGAVLIERGVSTPRWVGAVVAVAFVLALVPALHIASSILRMRTELSGVRARPARRPEIIVGTVLIALLAVAILVVAR